MIFSQFLHTSLGEHITEQGVSIEKVIDVEYVKKHPPLESQDRLIHDDWVSTVAVCEEWLVLLIDIKIKRIISKPILHYIYVN